MGDILVEANDSNPNGFYEDKEFRDLNMGFLSGTITTKDFIQGLRGLIQKRKEPWGVKDPRIAQLLPFYLSLLEDPTILWCQREMRETLDSMIKWYGWTEEYAVKVITTREQAIKTHTKGYNVKIINLTDNLYGQFSTN